MKILIVVTIVICSLKSFSQNVVAGNLIDYKSGQPIQHVALKVCNHSNHDSTGYFISDSMGRFSIELPNWNFSDTIQLTLSKPEFTTVIIEEILLNNDTIDLCNVYMYLNGGTWNGRVVTKRFLGIPIKKEYSGGRLKNYIDQNTVDGKIDLNYFCDQIVIAEPLNSGQILIKFKK